ncbi:MAG TPA: DedA family protein [Ktedonobacterales bacterium]|nr:DedA family protein [Ktedonobacterales bacterium]
MDIGRIIQELAQWLIEFYNAHQLPALFLLVLIEEAGIPIPIPGDTLVMIAGLQRDRGLLYDVTVIGLASLAVFLGSSVLYFVMRRGGRPFLLRFGKYLHLHPERLARVERWFLRRGRVAIVLGRLIPGIRIPTTVFAGLSGMTYSQYAPINAIAALIWSVVYFYLGVLFQEEVRYVLTILAGFLDDLSSPAVILWLLLILTIGGGGFHIFRRVRRHRSRAAARMAEESGTADAHGAVQSGEVHLLPRLRQPESEQEKTRPPATPSIS